jgi:Protein of unknown function (DUF2505)
VRFELVQQLRGELSLVEAAFVDDEFLAELGRLPKLGSPTFLDRQDDGSRVRQQVRYAFVGHLSPAVTAVVKPEKLTWVEDSTLDRATHATTFRILPDHYASMLQASGTITLRAGTAGGTIRRTDGELKVRVAFVGRKVEKAIISGLQDHAALEAGAVDRWLAERPE